jgi:hypothetical protein
LRLSTGSSSPVTVERVAAVSYIAAGEPSDDDD